MQNDETITYRLNVKRGFIFLRAEDDKLPIISRGGYHSGQVKWNSEEGSAKWESRPLKEIQPYLIDTHTVQENEKKRVQSLPEILELQSSIRKIEEEIAAEQMEHKRQVQVAQKSVAKREEEETQRKDNIDKEAAKTMDNLARDFKELFEPRNLDNGKLHNSVEKFMQEIADYYSSKQSTHASAAKPKKMPTKVAPKKMPSKFQKVVPKKMPRMRIYGKQ